LLQRQERVSRVPPSRWAKGPFTQSGHERPPRAEEHQEKGTRTSDVPPQGAETVSTRRGSPSTTRMFGCTCFRADASDDMRIAKTSRAGTTDSRHGRARSGASVHAVRVQARAPLDGVQCPPHRPCHLRPGASHLVWESFAIDYPNRKAALELAGI